MKERINTEPDRTFSERIAPVLWAFAAWTLERAAEDGVKRLYFLSRDGYIPHRFACAMAKERGLDVECRYLYCSRASLRIPSYHLLDRAEALELIGAPAQVLTPEGVLGRIRADEATRALVWREIGLKDSERNRPLTHAGRRQLLGRLNRSQTFWLAADRLSRAEYRPCMEYLRQEGLLDGERFALVDTGWTGSVQRTLRQLLESVGGRIPPLGYYFGLYRTSQDESDGIYRAYLFDENSPLGNLTKFNNNVFECMTRAPHAMVTGYREGVPGPCLKTVPILKEKTEISRLPQFDLLLKAYAETALESNFILLSDRCRKDLTAMTYRPDPEILRFFERQKFSDDPEETCMEPLIRPLLFREAVGLLLPVRIWNKFRKRKSFRINYWPYGSIAASDIPCKALFRWNVRIWESLRFRKMRRNLR